MEPQAIVAKLKTISLFKHLDYYEGELELYRLAPIVHTTEYGVGDHVFMQGQPSNRLWYVLEGQVRLTRIDREGITHFLRDVEPGESFGATGLLIGDFHDVTAEALTPVQMLYLEREEFLSIYQERPRLRRRLNIDDSQLKLRHTSRLNWMRDDEWIIFLGRRHWFYLFRRIATPLLLWVLLTVAIVMLGPSPEVDALLITLASLPALGFIGWETIDWRDDRFVVTTQRVVHVERNGPFRETFEESPLDNIQDIHEVRPSITSNLLNFGDLVLQTAGETVQIDMGGIPGPSRVRELIFREIERNRARQLLQSRGQIREALERRLRLEPPLPWLPIEGETIQGASVLALTVSWLHDLFFPPSWTMSADGQTIFWRRYWLPGLVRYFFLYLLWLAITVAGILIIPTLDPELQNLALALWLLAEVINFGVILWLVEDWRNDYFEITPTRLVLVYRKPFLLSESRRETTLDKIQNISFDKPTIFARLFDYGHVMIETAGAMGHFDLQWLRHPDKAQAEISKRQRELMERRRSLEAQQRREELLSWFATYDNLRGSAAAVAARTQSDGAGTDK